MRTKRQKIHLFLFTMGITLLLCLFTLEIYLRHTQTQIVSQITNPLIGSAERWPKIITTETTQGRRLIAGSHVLIKNHYLSHQDIKLDINSLGFRDDEITPEKSNDEIRILVLGDSIAYGDYLQSDEVFVQRIERYLSEMIPKRKIQVINTGITDIGLAEEMAILEERGLSLRPDLVLVEFYLNDSRPPWGFPGETGYRSWLRRNSMLAEYLWKNAELKKWMADTGAERFSWLKEVDKLDWVNDPADFERLAYLARYDWGAGFQPDSWPMLGAKFQLLADLADQYNFKVIVASFPVVFQVYAQFLENTPQMNVYRIAVENHFGFFDTLPLLRQHNQERLFFDQCHPVAKTNDLIGRALADYIIENDFLPLHQHN